MIKSYSKVETFTRTQKHCQFPECFHHHVTQQVSSVDMIPQCSLSSADNHLRISPIHHQPHSHLVLSEIMNQSCRGSEPVNLLNTQTYTYVIYCRITDDLTCFWYDTAWGRPESNLLEAIGPTHNGHADTGSESSASVLSHRWMLTREASL